jgi:hypothetical protein
MCNTRNDWIELVLKLCGKHLVRKQTMRWADNIKMNIWLWGWEVDGPDSGSCQVEDLLGIDYQNVSYNH